jgi:regulation of enolase protein 1 (concanavalin A-like superfamily)
MRIRGWSAFPVPDMNAIANQPGRTTGTGTPTLFMKTLQLSCLLSFAAFVHAQEPAVGEPAPAPDKSAPAEKPASEDKTIKGWGTPVDPAADCSFKKDGNKLIINVAGSAKPHDLSSELGSMTAPRVLQPLKGDFLLQVRVDGEFQPGGESTQEGRTGYTGAGLVVMADEKNFVRIERASLNHGEEDVPYINFEIRVNGQLERIGTTGDFEIDGTKPVWFRLERKGDKMLGSMSQDGKNWVSGDPKELRADAWKKPNVAGGVAAISTSVKSFAPVYADLSVAQGAESSPVGEPK